MMLPAASIFFAAWGAGGAWLRALDFCVVAGDEVTFFFSMDRFFPMRVVGVEDRATFRVDVLESTDEARESPDE